MLLGPLVAGLLTAPLFRNVLFSDDPQSVSMAQTEVEALRGDIELRAELGKRLRKTSRIHKRLYTAVRVGYLKFGDRSEFLQGKRSPAETQEGESSRHDRFGYFLDPWNNPYWLLVNRKKKDAWIYSFGANRQRDSDLKRDGQMSGDDIGVRFSFDVNRPSMLADSE